MQEFAFYIGPDLGANIILPPLLTGAHASNFSQN